MPRWSWHGSCSDGAFGNPSATCRCKPMLAPRDNHLDKSWTLVFQLLHGRLTLDDVAKQIGDAALPALQARVDGLLRQLSFQEEQDNEARLRRLFRDLAHDGRGLVDFT